MKNSIPPLMALFLVSANAFASSVCLVAAQSGTVTAVCDGKVVASQPYGAWPDALVQKSLVLKQLTDQEYEVASEVLGPAGVVEYLLKR